MHIRGIGTQTFVWRQHYSQRDEVLEEHLVEVLADVADAGCDGLVGRLAWMATDRHSELLASLLERHNLEMVAFYHSGILHNPEAIEETVARILEWTIRGERFVECSNLIVDAQHEAARPKTGAELDHQTQYFNRLGADLSRLGGQLFIHNHTCEIKDDARELRATCDKTDPQLVNLCFDVHWAHRAGMDPFQLIREYPERIKSLHLRNSVNGIWTEALGDGDVDYRRLAQLLDEICYEGWLSIELAYEQGTKVTQPIRKNLRNSRDYICDVFELGSHPPS